MMAEDVELPVVYKGEERLLPARLVKVGYVYRIEVDIEDQTIIFELDEERNWRALTDPEKNNSKIDIELIKAIGFLLEEMML